MTFPTSRAGRKFSKSTLQNKARSFRRFGDGRQDNSRLFRGGFGESAQRRRDNSGEAQRVAGHYGGHRRGARQSVFGRERRKLMDSDEKKLTAYHEAGHALIQAVIDDGRLPIHKVTIIPRGQSLGSTMFVPSRDIRTESKSRCSTTYAQASAGELRRRLYLPT